MPRPRVSSTGRTRGSWTPRLAGIGAVVLVAAGAAIAYSVASSASASRSATQLPTRVQSVQTVGIISQLPGPSGRAIELRQLDVTPADLQFGPLPPASLPQGDPQWTADTIVGGTLVFIYAPNGKCLASMGSARRPVVTLRRCDLGPEQRWQRVSAALRPDGHEYGQIRNLRNGRCLTVGDPVPGSASLPAGLARCSTAPPASQLLSFWWSA
ncbi:MAG TPA: hypothetical protein VMV07_15335 [Streptosporangiaceae bacterium]|nr:hypothetical protein [Streptosporangiaceae bacterium]